MKYLILIFALILSACGSDSSPTTNKTVSLDSLYLGVYVGYAPTDVIISNRIYPLFRIETTKQDKWLYLYDEPNCKFLDRIEIQYYATNGIPNNSDGTMTCGSNKYSAYIIW